MGGNSWYSCGVTGAHRCCVFKSKGGQAKSSLREEMLSQTKANVIVFCVNPVCRVAIELLLTSTLAGECPDVA